MKRASLLWFQAMALIVSLSLLSCGGGGGGGIPVETDDEPFALAIDSNGNLVTAGFANNGAQNEFALIRYTTAGALDTTFNTTGIVTTAIGDDDEASALAIQSDGNLVAAGISLNLTLAQSKFALVRYNTDGSLDASFGTGGIVTTAIGTFDDEAFALAIQSDGKLVVAGYSFNGTQNVFALVRYNTDGSLDTTFNTTGIVTTAIGIDDDEINSLAIDSNGNLVAAGFSLNGTLGNYEFAMARYTTAGALDTTFNTTGIVTTVIGTDDDEINSLAIDSNGNLVAAGFSLNDTLGQYEFAMARYTTAGALDTTFNTAGIVTTAIGTVDDEINSLAIDSNGNLVAAGFSFSNTLGQSEFAMARYTPAGALDTTFNTTGFVTTAIGTVDDEINSLAIDSNGDLVAAGFSLNDTLGQYEFAMARYTPAGALDTTFNTTGIVTTAIKNP
jgi:uncharacterized delta-60 repeat protein